MAKYVIMSDLHANMSALTAVVEDIRVLLASNDVGCGITGIFLLGDLIDYGMQSNEVVSFVRQDLEEKLGASVIASIWGNHEHVCITGTDFDRLSSKRTVASAKYTASILSGATKVYLETEMKRSGMHEISIDGKNVLLVHGSLRDPLFGHLMPEDVQGEYGEYDVVMSGHTHFSHAFTRFYPCESESLRNKKPTLFINPGSVGQPRNRNPHAQYAIWDSVTNAVELRAVAYDIEKAMSLYNGQVDDFYRDRLNWGV